MRYSCTHALQTGARLVVAVLVDPPDVRGVDDAGVHAPPAGELLGRVAVDTDVGGHVLYGAVVVDVPAERDHRAGHQQIAFALQVVLRLPAAGDLVGERALALLEQDHHGVEGVRELTHEVDALRVVAAGDLLGLTGELVEVRVHLDQRDGHVVVGRGERRGELAAGERHDEDHDLLEQAQQAVDRMHQRDGDHRTGDLAHVPEAASLQQLGERLVDLAQTGGEVAAVAVFDVGRHGVNS